MLTDLARTGKAVALYAGIAVMVSVLSAGCLRPQASEGGHRAEAVHSPFDSAAWKSGAPGVRGSMANDLVDRELLVGKTRAEVKSLLGEPDQEGLGFLVYFVYFGADNSVAPAYIIHVEFNQRGEEVKDARIDADMAPGTD